MFMRDFDKTENVLYGKLQEQLNEKLNIDKLVNTAISVFNVQAGSVFVVVVKP